MGSFEKLVVATVFFLSAIVLAVSLSSREDAPGAPAAGGTAVPGAGGERVALAAPAPTDAASQGTSPAAEGAAERPAPARATRPPPLLSTSVDPTGSTASATEQAPAKPPASEDRAPATDGRLLVRDGLERSPLEGRQLYTWRAGDSWTLVAERLFGSGSWADALRVANDDARPVAGDRVFVLERLGAAPRDESADPRLARPAPRQPHVEPITTPVTTTEDGAFVEHVVRDGETLSSIAERYYGTSARWQRIHDANRDLLANPDRLTVGTRLRIP